MELQCKVEVGAAARAKVFAFWTDGAKRGLWEDDLERLAIDGEIKAGASGVMKLRDKPEMRFTIIEALDGEIYSERYDLPFGTLIFAHGFSTEGGKSYITHGVKLEKSSITEEDLAFLNAVFADFPIAALRLKNLLEER
ncbi:MAG: hypothetical protein LBE89_05660 [Helicobacteraceae bacterium]|jgi:hypothetical protein|nr:hypothetical protein [Helicobacteraceae bacterium]